MGDRGNIVMHYSAGADVYFYGHWAGSELKEIVASALERGKSRWNDEGYLARIIFCELVKDNVMGTTGFGITPYEGDNENPIVTVTPEHQIVVVEGKVRSFNEFVDEFLPPASTEPTMRTQGAAFGDTVFRMLGGKE